MLSYNRNATTELDVRDSGKRWYLLEHFHFQINTETTFVECECDEFYQLFLLAKIWSRNLQNIANQYANQKYV